MQLVLRLIAIVSFIVAIVWVFQVGGLEPEPILAFLGGLTSLALSFANEKKENKETLDQRNRRVMLDHVENFWVKGILEKSLHGAALLELGIKEDPTAVNYPWTIKKESTNETLPAGKSMLEIFKEIGLGRSLLILGAPGSGKSTMLLELARQLIERARKEETDSIPVVFNLASWKEKQRLADWIAEQLNIVYFVPKKIAPAWVNENLMLLLLDGLDEVKEDSRVKCVDAINQFRKEHGLTSLVVCSRIEEYSTLNTKLSMEGAITIQPLTSKQINAYFDRFGKSLAGAKQLLKKDKALQELTETPLILSIISLAYKDIRTDELIASGNLEKQRKHLFDTYITRMFERSPRATNATFSKQQTLHYLSWLAGKMIQHNIITYQIEAMQPFWLEKVSQRRLYQIFGGLLVGLLFGLLFGLLVGLLFGLSVGLLAGLSFRLGVGLFFGPLAGLSFGLLAGLSGGLFSEIVLVDKLKWSWKAARGALLDMLRPALSFGLFFGLSFGLLAGLSEGLSEGLSFGLRFGLSSGLIVGLFGVLSVGLSSEQVEETTRPGRRLIQTFLNTIFAALFVVLLVGLIVGLSFGLIGGLIVGLIGGLLVGLGFGGRAFIQHYSLRLVLARNNLLPSQLIAFLDSAVDLIFLRRVGGSYIFVHRLLMEHFAEMEV